MVARRRPNCLWGQTNDDLKTIGIYVVDAKGGKPRLRVRTGTSSPPAWAKGSVRFTVDPQEKLTITWGAIKKDN